MSETRYQVVAECAHATVHTMFGRTVTLLEKGALVPADTPNLKHLLDIGAVAEVGDEATGGVDADGVPSGAYDVTVPEGITSTPVPEDEERRAEAEKAKADADLAAKRADAQSKLPADGSLPDGRAGKDVWVEYLVANGYDYDTVSGADKAELVDLGKKVDADRK